MSKIHVHAEKRSKKQACAYKTVTKTNVLSKKIVIGSSDNGQAKP